MKLLLIAMLFLVGCGHTTEIIYIDKPVLIPVVCEDFGRIDPVRALPVKFVNATDVNGFQVLGLRGDMYSNLAIVIRDSLRYIGEQKNAIDYYKGCIQSHNSTPLKKEGQP